jgi:hypothetical protein
MNATVLTFRLNSLLTLLVGALLAAYVALVVVTVVFAAVQTKLAQHVQEQRMEISKLETSYFAAIAALDTTDPYALGYVKPHSVQYVSAAKLPNLTFAR